MENFCLQQLFQFLYKPTLLVHKSEVECYLKIFINIRILRHWQLLIQTNFNVRDYSNTWTHPAKKDHHHNSSDHRLHQQRNIENLKQLVQDALRVGIYFSLRAMKETTNIKSIALKQITATNLLASKLMKYSLFSYYIIKKFMLSEKVKTARASESENNNICTKMWMALNLKYCVKW